MSDPYHSLGDRLEQPGASVHEVDADHAVCITAPQMFAQVLLQACWSVTPGPLAQPQSAG